MRATLRLLVLLLLLPATARPNGGSSGVSSRTSGAMAGAHPGPLSDTAIVQEEDVECLSERLTITLKGDEVLVQVDYVFINRGATKTLRYAFPFALGEQDALVNGVRKDTRRFGEPTSYAIVVDGKPVKAEKRAGAPVPPEIPTPRIEDNTDAPEGWMPGEEPGPRLSTVARYRWSYRVSSITFPAGVERKVRVSYTVPYLVYTKTSDLGHATSPGEFSYLLSTGGKWQGGSIGSLTISVKSDTTPLSQVQVDGLPFRRERAAWIFEAKDFRPTTSTNLVLRRSELARLLLRPGEEVPEELVRESAGLLRAGWMTLPVGGKVPVRIELLVGDGTGMDDGAAYRRGYSGSGRYRLGLAFSEDAHAPRLIRTRVELAFANREPEIFHATFAKVDPRDVVAAGGYRAIWFDAPEEPTRITLVPLEVAPGTGGDRHLQIDHVVLDHDVSNYDAYVQRPR